MISICLTTSASVRGNFLKKWPWLWGRVQYYWHILYNLFKSSLFYSLFKSPLPSWGKPHANIFWEHCLLPLLKFVPQNNFLFTDLSWNHFSQAKVVYKHDAIPSLYYSQLKTKTTFAWSNKGKCSTILRLCCCSQGWDFISTCTWISTQLGQAGLNSTWAENTR